MTLNISRVGSSKTSLGNLCRGFTTLSVKNVFLVLVWYLLLYPDSYRVSRSWHWTGEGDGDHHVLNLGHTANIGYYQCKIGVFVDNAYQNTSAFHCGKSNLQEKSQRYHLWYVSYVIHWIGSEVVSCCYPSLGIGFSGKAASPRAFPWAGNSYVLNKFSLDIFSIFSGHTLQGCLVPIRWNVQCAEIFVQAYQCVSVCTCVHTHVCVGAWGAAYAMAELLHMLVDSLIDFPPKTHT